MLQLMGSVIISLPLFVSVCIYAYICTQEIKLCDNKTQSTWFGLSIDVRFWRSRGCNMLCLLYKHVTSSMTKCRDISSKLTATEEWQHIRLNKLGAHHYSSVRGWLKSHLTSLDCWPNSNMSWWGHESLSSPLYNTAQSENWKRWFK